MVEELIRSLTSDARLAGTVHIFDSIGDDELAILYESAAFCLYPSIYEGYGLPIVEAFSHGKAVLASNGGALPETVGDLSPCLDPHDHELWYSMMKCWMLEPEARKPYEVAIQQLFRAQSWRETAAHFLRALGLLDGPESQLGGGPALSQQ
jgi:glycosyltransferase involved in cell wall biosynthesis